MQTARYEHAFQRIVLIWDEYNLQHAAQVLVRLYPGSLSGHTVSGVSHDYQQCCSIALQCWNPTPFVCWSQKSMSLSRHLHWPLQRARRTSTSNMEMEKGSCTNRSTIDFFMTVAALHLLGIFRLFFFFLIKWHHSVFVVTVKFSVPCLDTQIYFSEMHTAPLPCIDKNT